ncbi:periplasmic inhibitor [Vibrio ishigakensis]|nr:periplasmic inhibitor [Vibrio ishigakensis]
MRAQMKANKAKERELVLAADFNEQEAQALAQEMVEQRANMQVEKMRVQHRMMSVLTAEQKDKLVQMQDERMQKCEQKMEKKMEKKRANNG